MTPLSDREVDERRASVAPIAELVNARTGLDLTDDEMGRMIGHAAADLVDTDALIAVAREHPSLDRRPSVRAFEDERTDRIREARRRCDELGVVWDIR